MRDSVGGRGWEHGQTGGRDWRERGVTRARCHSGRSRLCSCPVTDTAPPSRPCTGVLFAATGGAMAPEEVDWMEVREGTAQVRDAEGSGGSTEGGEGMQDVEMSGEKTGDQVRR